ncbi:hypothetical protein CXG81DRAFT_29230 [Caulochytrium protostelioides]|uniref:Large ribosomal subunit protein uL14m n=1 Tax=Caulochytrium protostelioides TaxID=1555241 RepID=A0A4P9X170_9FUNG|nr:ribosomal protein L14 [Caulochytrium protostelioides]RKP03529.1 hypothetical protein CXG81DRAFT_29230 [Caulochytrium protostelioides]|eukprot:RKP03529.1 hypothetical protein CXG81DRAFT_29230 [Caulochytrium protostelioides]
MIQLKTLCKVVDNSGGLIAECINVMSGARTASVGDEIVCVVKKARPVVAGAGSGAATAPKVRKGEVTRGVVVRTRQAVQRLDGSWVKFDDNAVVLTNPGRQPLGNRILGVVANECRQKRWAKIASLAPRFV